MDNNAFEKDMINTVNKHANDVTANAKFAELSKAWKKRRKAQRILAVIEMALWLIAFAAVCVVLAVNEIPRGLDIATTAFLGFLTGIRVCGLIRSI